MKVRKNVDIIKGWRRRVAAHLVLIVVRARHATFGAATQCAALFLFRSAQRWFPLALLFFHSFPLCTRTPDWTILNHEKRSSLPCDTCEARRRRQPQGKRGATAAPKANCAIWFGGGDGGPRQVALSLSMRAREAPIGWLAEKLERRPSCTTQTRSASTVLIELSPNLFVGEAATAAVAAHALLVSPVV